MRLDSAADALTITGDDYRLAVPVDRPVAMLSSAAGVPWADLRLLLGVDTIAGPDETFAVEGPTVERSDDAVGLSWRVASSRWSQKTVVATCTAAKVELYAEVEGGGRPGDVTFLGGQAALPGAASGWFSSRRRFETLFSAAPSDPGRVVQPASESADNSASAGAEPGRGHWFFTPGPLLYAVSASHAGDSRGIPPGPWLAFSVVTTTEAKTFLGFGYRAVDRGFHFVLDYEGQTRVAGRWRTPSLVIAPAADPYAAIADHRNHLEQLDHVQPTGDQAAGPAWWREPIFCGWGAQCARARKHGLPLSRAADFATQQDYEDFLAILERRGIVPGTIAIDNKWAFNYTSAIPDPAKWPDLRGWIDARHLADQRVVLWWKAWDVQALPAESCVRTPTGRPVAADPDNPAAAATIRATIRQMLGPGGLDADGLKIDFTARTPSGSSLVHAGDGWGIELLRRLLALVHDEAKSIKPECLLVGHVPEPTLAPLVDMIRLNDMLRLDDPEPGVPIAPQMTFRAGVVRAACPGHLIDTDDWCAPDLENWRAYWRIKADLGVPALYYADRLDVSGEELRAEDYDLVARTWSDYREHQGLPARNRVPAKGVTNS